MVRNTRHTQTKKKTSGGGLIGSAVNAFFGVCSRANAGVNRIVGTRAGINVALTTTGFLFYLVSVENIFVQSLPAINYYRTRILEQGEEQVYMQNSYRFLPKPFVDDGADLNRMLPYRTVFCKATNIPRAVVNKANPLRKTFKMAEIPLAKCPAYKDWFVMKYPGYLIGSFLAATLAQIFETRAIRSRSRAARRREYEALMNFKKLATKGDETPKQQWLAFVHNNSGTKRELFWGAMILAIYITELWVAFTALRVNNPATFFYAIGSVFGFEVCNALTLSEDDLEDAEHDTEW